MRGQRGTRAATVTLGVAPAVAICLAVLGAATRAPRAWAFESPAASLITRVLHDVSVAASLKVETPEGEVVPVLVQDRQTTLGVAQEWRGRLRLGLAVFTVGNPGSQYGLDTIRGVTERLLRR